MRTKMWMMIEDFNRKFYIVHVLSTLVLLLSVMPQGYNGFGYSWRATLFSSSYLTYYFPMEDTHF